MWKLKTKLLFIILCTLIPSSVLGQGKELKRALDYVNQGYIVAGLQSLKDCANHNDVWAQFYLGQCYEYGYFGNINLQDAFLFYRKTAERGLPIGQYMVAKCYEKGLGTSINLEKAKIWYKKSEGKYNLQDLSYFTSIYSNGLNLPENYNVSPSTNLANSIDNKDSDKSTRPNNQTINNITIVQSTPNQSEVQSKITPQQDTHKSDVDQNVPANKSTNENAFALIIANENYQDVVNVPNALNDGEIFAEYCKKTLGLPTTNVTLVKDATLNNIKREITKLSKIANVYKGEAKIIFYYAGHGVPDETTKDAFLLPVDGYGTDSSTGYSLKDLYSTLGNMPTEQVVVLLDACFSGSQRGDGMLTSARGVAIKAKTDKTEGKMVVISAAQGDETAYPYQEERHGLFTYYLLKKLKESQGNVSLGELASYIKDNVSKKSIVVNGKSQTPSINPSASLGESWKNWTLK